MLGLNIDEARDVIEDFRERGILQCEEEDRILVDEKEGMQSAKCLMDFLKDETSYNDKKRMDLDETIEPDAAPLQQDKPCCPCSSINSYILSSFSQLTGSMAELHEVKWKERHDSIEKICTTVHSNSNISTKSKKGLHTCSDNGI